MDADASASDPAATNTPFAVRPGAPALPPGTVARPRLLDRMRAVAAMPVVSVCAPAGYGKSTLLAQWASEDERPCAWLSLQPGDDDPVSLLTRVAGVLDALEEVGPDVFDALRAGPAAVVPLALPRLGRALGARHTPFLLVLDDAQHLASPRAVDALRVLIDHLPSGSQLLLGSRVEPAFPTARLVVERRLAVLDATELEMTPTEGTDLLRAAGVDLSRQESEAVVRQTEGWAAALYLASLALRDQPSGDERAPFTGRDRPLADYFREEVLVQADAEQVAFLTRTSMLGRLTAPLCDAVLERTDSAAMLRALAEAHLFVTPLDDREEWYRVHQLFAESLAEELRRTEPGAEAGLHRRASDWFLGHGELEQAVWHARESGDVAYAADLVWLSVPAIIPVGKTATYMRWLAWFDDEQIAANAILAVGAAWCELELGDGDRARDWLAIGAAAPAGIVLSDGSPLEAQVALSRAALHTDGIRPVRQQGELARDLMPPDHPWRCLAHYLAGVGDHLLGNPEPAHASLAEAERISRVFAPSIHILALAQQAIMATEAGDWATAQSLCRRARDLQREHGLEDYASGAHVAAVVAYVAAQAGDLPAARTSARRAATILAAQRHFAPWAAGQARVLLARTHLLTGDAIAARTVLAEAAGDLARLPDAVVLQAAYEEARAAVDGARVSIPGGPSSLTTSEVRVLQYLPTHMSFREIGEQLYVSRNTVKTHALSVYRKLEASSRSEAVERARALGILEPTGPAVHPEGMRTGVPAGA